MRIISVLLITTFASAKLLRVEISEAIEVEQIGATPQERVDIVAFHNQKRSSVKPTASNMMAMVYDEEMEKLAVEWVSKCRFEHPDRREYPQYAGVGQNLAITGGSPRNLVENAELWWDEVRYFNYSTNKCQAGKVCGHYTQVVWYASDRIGCAVKRCDGIKERWPSPIYLTACQYRLPGNWVGEKPYKQGKPCAECPPGTVCINNLCHRKSQQLDSKSPLTTNERTTAMLVESTDEKEDPRPSERERFELVQLHNHLRANAYTPASNMKKMTYSSDLEAIAVQWVSRCKNEMATEEPFSKYGQNIMGSVTISRSVGYLAHFWWQEGAYYDFRTNGCAEGRNCLAYKQAVWSNATQLGCAIGRCDYLQSETMRPTYLMTCFYDVKAEADQKPFIEGPPCSNCPEGYHCEEKLCTRD